MFEDRLAAASNTVSKLVAERRSLLTQNKRLGYMLSDLRASRKLAWAETQKYRAQFRTFFLFGILLGLILGIVL